MNKIADISSNQGAIDWLKASAELDLVIIRASKGIITDTKYAKDASGCFECGIPFGVYHYVKASNADEAKHEAEFFLQCINKSNVLPNFYIADIENEAQTAENTEEVCTSFLQTLRDAGCLKIGMYINRKYRWAGKAIDMCDIMWIPHWGKNDGEIPDDMYKPDYPCDIWQYTSKGRLDGIDGNVDLSVINGDKPLEYFKAEGGILVNKLNPNAFAEWLKQRAKAKDGYIMSTVGQNPKELSSWYFNQYNPNSASAGSSASAKNYAKALYWKANAERVFDCQGMADCYVTENTGTKTNVKARNNYADWCSVKGKGLIPIDKRVLGAAVFKKGTSSYIHHVGFIVELIDGGKDAYIVEAKGVTYGVITSKLSDGGWDYWGWMDKYFDYSITDKADVETEIDDETQKYIVTGGSVWVWDNHPDESGKKKIILHKGDTVEQNGEMVGKYLPIRYEGSEYWINSIYTAKV